MTALDLPSCWAARFGLALAPLFEEREARDDGSHHVLLDGGFGSFALSVTESRLWQDRGPVDWSWSSNLPHHVTVTDREVAVVRWDKTRPELLTRSSVENQLEAFYAYLTADRVKSSQRVVDHMLTLFRRVRSLVADARIDDEKSVDTFLAFLAQAMARTRDAGGTAPEIAPEGGEELLKALSPRALDALHDDAISRNWSTLPVALLPELAVRHAGSEIFQEAHFELLRAPSPDLFGYAGPAEIRHTTRGGAHFTPPALARTIVEQALAQLPDVRTRDRLVVLDPACGSGAFLHEAIRTLRREGFNGKLVIVGRDTSPPAVSMARFVMRRAQADWLPAGGWEIDIKSGNSLKDEMPTADVIVMNPPFVAWSALSSEQRAQMEEVLRDRLAGRGDFSMAFVTRALENLAPGGVLGTILPGSLLTLQAAENWRRDLLDRADLRFVASLGDYGLFAFALVQVAAAVFAKPRIPADRRDQVAALVTANNADATGNALRTLRRDKAKLELTDESNWRLFQMSTDQLRQRPTWRLVPPRTEIALKRIVDVGGAVPLGRLFDVRQGVRTGANPAFLLSEEQLQALPAKEREWFRPAVMSESIANGQVKIGQFVFYPYDRGGLRIVSEQELVHLLPEYFDRYLAPQKTKLQGRANIVRANRVDWWGLSERRAWALDPVPRIISKYFGGAGGFATDLEARFIVVQGFAWFPKWNNSPNSGEEAVEPITTSDILAAYMALMNSAPFARLLEIFSPHVAGGQFDLSPRYVDAIPVPDFSALSTDKRMGQIIQRLVSLGQKPRLAELEWRALVDRLSAELYGSDLIDQV